MKLIYCIPSLESSGGTERVLVQRVNYLIGKGGYEIYIITTDQTSEKIFFELSPSVHLIHLNIDFASIENLPLWKKIIVYKKKQQLYRRKLEQLLVTIKPDITTSLLSHEIDFLPGLKDGSYKIGENHFNKSFRYDFIRTKDFNWLRKGVAYLRYMQLVLCVRRLDCLVSLTNQDSGLWNGVRLKKVIPNFLYHFPLIHSLCDNKEVVAVGRYAVEKGFDMLLKAWCRISERYPDWHLSVYGDGGCRHEMEEFIKENALENVDLYYPTHAIYEAYARSSIAVVPSRFEGFGMVIIEAMACGVPVVAFDCKSGPAEIISDGEDGFLVEANHIDQLVEKVAELIDHNEKRKLMGAKAMEHVRRYSAENMMKEWIGLYNKVLRMK